MDSHRQSAVKIIYYLGSAYQNEGLRELPSTDCRGMKIDNPEEGYIYNEPEEIAQHLQEKVSSESHLPYQAIPEKEEPQSQIPHSFNLQPQNIF
jgi:hypothetical protein